MRASSLALFAVTLACKRDPVVIAKDPAPPVSAAPSQVVMDAGEPQYTCKFWIKNPPPGVRVKMGQTELPVVDRGVMLRGTIAQMFELTIEASDGGVIGKPKVFISEDGCAPEDFDPKRKLIVKPP